MRLSALALSLATLLAGCTGAFVQPASVPEVTDVLGRGFDTSRAWSTPLSPALYPVMDGLELMLPSFDETPISVSLFFPDIEGCDWTSDALPDACRLPVVMDSGPYYADHIDVQKYRPPITEWLTPRGYVTAHMSVRGTGESGGCMEFMSMNEQKDVDAIVTWLGTQPWSTGSVGMMGRSYDGTTPLMAAALGNPYLKTIVPISGVASVPDLMFKNGTSETRGPIMHSVVYWALYGVGAGDGGAPGHRADELPSQACPELARGQAEGAAAVPTGDASGEYWQVRDFRQRILDNYQGSIWIVHGLEDWNVNPSQVVPWINELQDAGIKTKAWLGVWGHAYPDRVDEHRNVRWDWAEWTVRWFDSELKGLAVDTGPAIEVEDSLYVWRAEESYPPRDATPFELFLGGDGLVPATPSGGDMLVAPNVPASIRSEVLENATRIAGLPQVHVTVTPTSAAGGWLFSELYDIYPDGRAVRIGWGAIDLKHHDGGNGAPEALVPGQPIVALLQMEPVDALVGAGHRIELRLHMDGVEDIPASPVLAPIRVALGEDSVLRLPVIVRENVVPSYAPPGL